MVFPFSVKQSLETAYSQDSDTAMVPFPRYYDDNPVKCSFGHKDCLMSSCSFHKRSLFIYGLCIRLGAMGNKNEFPRI